MVHEDGNPSLATKVNNLSMGSHRSFTTHFYKLLFSLWLLLTLWLVASFIVAHTLVKYLEVECLEQTITNIWSRGVQFCARFHCFLWGKWESWVVIFFKTWPKIIYCKLKFKKTRDATPFVCASSNSVSYIWSLCNILWK